jgi:diaminohydroxyphosphoribosylaminopyrimidine deaminase / 5-amino-6-(5-phosphoribosylamino)uracil reductase
MDYLRRALDLAERAVGRTSPNPAVGAVVVKDGLVVGEGYTQPLGSPHAEIMAIAAAGSRADGADLYVTLEPCDHYGHTPPCTSAIIQAGIRRVYVAVLDPNPLVHGKGIARLEAADVSVVLGEHAVDATSLNRPFFHYMQTGRPFVTAKWAMTLDGKIATETGDSRWVTGSEARRFVHRERDASDAILVGVGTVLADDPQLTVRLPPEDQRRAPRSDAPWRVVFDSHARTPAGSALVAQNHDRRTLILCAHAAPAERVAELRDTGVEVIVGESELNGRVAIDSAGAELAKRGAIRLLLEGGGELTGAFIDRGRVDRVLGFVAPKIVGGRLAPSPVSGRGHPLMANAIELHDTVVHQVGSDWLFEGLVGVG